MQTLTISVIDAKAMKLIEDLESLNLIRVISKEGNPLKQKLSEKYLGKLSSKVADDLQNHITQSRKEWDSLNGI